MQLGDHRRLKMPDSLEAKESKSKMIAANSITLRMDVTSSVNPRCRDEKTGAGNFSPRQQNKSSSPGLPQVAVIDQFSPEQVYDFHSKVTAVVLNGQRLSGSS